MDDCCRRYLRYSMECHIDWANEALMLLDRNDPYLVSVIAAIENFGHDDKPITTPVGLLSKILQGEPCPWHDGVPEDYLAVMAFMRR
jgi:hypothetical protein